MPSQQHDLSAVSFTLWKIKEVYFFTEELVNAIIYKQRNSALLSLGARHFPLQGLEEMCDLITELLLLKIQ